MKVSQAILLYMRQNGGVLPPATMEQWLALLVQHGLIEIEIRPLDGFNLPHFIITDRGRAHLEKAGL